MAALEAQRLTSERSRANATSGRPGPEGSIGKLVGAELNQQIYQFCMDLLGPEGILYHSYDVDGAGGGDWRGPIQQRFLRQPCQHHRRRNVRGDAQHPGERILGLPGDMRADAGMPWKEVPRG